MKIKLNLNWCFLFFVFLFTSAAYAFDAWGINFPLAIIVLLIFAYDVISVFKQQKIRLTKYQSTEIYYGYGLLLVIAVFSGIINGFPKFSIHNMAQFFYMPFFVSFLHNVIKTRSTIYRLMRLIGWVFWLNLIAFLFQQFVLGMTRDELAGIFGVTTGNQSYSSMLLVLYSLYVLAMYNAKRMSGKYTVAVLAACLYQAAIGEVKVYFVALILIMGCLFFMSRFSLRKCGIAIVLLVCGMLAVAVLEALYPEFAGFLSPSAILNTITNDRGYTKTGDINRLNGVFIMRQYMNTPQVFLMGIGVGNGASETAFHRSFGWLHYNWFSYSYIFVELGILGLITILATHIIDSLHLLRGYYHEKDEELKNWFMISFIYSVIIFAYLFYNRNHFTIIGALYNSLLISIPSIYQKARENRRVQ